MKVVTEEISKRGGNGLKREQGGNPKNQEKIRIVEQVWHEERKPRGEIRFHNLLVSFSNGGARVLIIALPCFLKE